MVLLGLLGKKSFNSTTRFYQDPFHCRLGIKNNEIITNPTRRELKESSIDLIVAATKQNLVVMIEGKGDIILLQDLLKAIKHGTREAQLIIAQIEKMRKEIPILKPKRDLEEKKTEVSKEIHEAIETMSSMRLKDIFRDKKHDKLSRDNAISSIRQEVISSVWSSFPDNDTALISDEFNKFVIATFRNFIFEENIRCDGRGFDDLRNISCGVNLFEPLHGSALFTRGQTQVLASVTLDSKESALKLDSLSALETGIKEKNFFCHYEFPPYATGEIGRMGIVNRRELGHGALAEKALVPIIPQSSPFTIRLSAEVLESNGTRKFYN
jgi:polyribonucleotide nucleotidyltransferase